MPPKKHPKPTAKRSRGRPALGVELSKQVNIQITAAEDEAIAAEQASTGLSRTQVILRRLFSGPRDNPTLLPERNAAQ